MSHHNDVEEVKTNGAPAPAPAPKASATPLGLFTFGLSMFMLSLLSVRARQVTHLNMIVPCGLMVGGAGQFLACILEWARGSTFLATLWGLYSTFFASLAIIFWPVSGVIAGHTDAAEFSHALGMYMVCWAVITASMTVGATRTNFPLLVLFASVLVVFILNAAGFSTDSAKVLKAAGYFGFVTAAAAIYAGSAALWASVDLPFALPVGSLQRA